MSRDDNLSVMVCNGCGFVDVGYKPDITQADVLENPRATLKAIKQHFRDQGWYTSWGYDLCPKCYGAILDKK